MNKIVLPSLPFSPLPRPLPLPFPLVASGTNACKSMCPYRFAHGLVITSRSMHPGMVHVGTLSGNGKIK